MLTIHIVKGIRPLFGHNRNFWYILISRSWQVKTMQTELIDPFGRKIEYVRLSVTDRCDMRCFYCMPKGFKDFEEPEDWLTFAEIERVIRAFGELGVSRVRLTGGEPLVRKGIVELAWINMPPI